MHARQYLLCVPAAAQQPAHASSPPHPDPSTPPPERSKTTWQRLPQIVRGFDVTSTTTSIASALGGIVVRGDGCLPAPLCPCCGCRLALTYPHPCPHARTQYLTIDGGRNLGTSVEVQATGGFVRSAQFRAEADSDADWATQRDLPAPWGEIGSRKNVIASPRLSLRQVDTPSAVTRYWDTVRGGVPPAGAARDARAALQRRVPSPLNHPELRTPPDILCRCLMPWRGWRASATSAAGQSASSTTSTSPPATCTAGARAAAVCVPGAGCAAPAGQPCAPLRCRRCPQALDLRGQCGHARRRRLGPCSSSLPAAPAPIACSYPIMTFMDVVDSTLDPASWKWCACGGTRAAVRRCGGGASRHLSPRLACPCRHASAGDTSTSWDITTKIRHGPPLERERRVLFQGTAGRAAVQAPRPCRRCTDALPPLVACCRR